MRKFVCLLGVLVFTVSAQATMSLAFRCPDATGGQVPQKSDLRIEIFSPDTAATSFEISIQCSDPITASQVAVGAYNPAFNGSTCTPGTPRNGSKDPKDMFIEKIYGTMSSGSPIAIGTWLGYFTIDTSLMSPGTEFSIDKCLGTSSYSPYRTLVCQINGTDMVETMLTNLEVIPEPASLILLALGGLALRRRK